MEAMRVLAVAHDETTLRLCLLGLGVEGMDVVHAIDLESAVEAARGVRPAAIVLDTTIPTGAGLSVLRGLVDGVVTADIPVVTLVDREDPGARMAHWIAGAAATIVKPFSLDELTHTVREFGRMAPERVRAYHDDVLARLREMDRTPTPN